MSLFDVTLFATAFATLTVIMDPVGTVPIFLGLTSRYSQVKQRRAAKVRMTPKDTDVAWIAALRCLT